MNHLVIIGNMGSGKTMLAKKMIQNSSLYQLSEPVIHIEIDNIIRCWHAKKNIQRALQKIWKQNGVYIKNTACCSQFSKQKFQILFKNTSLQKERAWNSLENLFHPLLSKFIFETITHTHHQKGTIIWDAALWFLFPHNNIQYVETISSSVYTTLFSLKKYRNQTYKKSLFLLNRQRLQSSRF